MSRDKVDRLADNSILMLIGALNKEFGGRKNWPTNTAGLNLKDFEELMVNSRIMEKLNDPDAGTENPAQPNNDYLENFVPEVDNSGEATPKQKQIRRKRQEQFRKFNKRYKKA